MDVKTIVSINAPTNTFPYFVISVITEQDTPYTFKLTAQAGADLTEQLLSCLDKKEE